MRKSILAALLISLGSAALYLAPAPIGAFLFAFGLYCVCELKANLYTGKCGYILENKQYNYLAGILILNLVFGWIFGRGLGTIYPDIISAAIDRINSWIDPWTHLYQSFFCGCIMFIAVEIKNKYKHNAAIFLGVPLFILAGFQHSIANIITCGIANMLSPYILIAIVGNTIGSIFIWLLIQFKSESPS